MFPTRALAKMRFTILFVLACGVVTLKDFGMDSGIPFIHIANRVEVDVDLHGKRVSGPPLEFKKV